MLDRAELVARQILRNSQFGVRSAKETVLDVIGRPLDDQLRLELLYAHSSNDWDETRTLLDQFYAKRDAGRAGRHATPLEGGAELGRG